VPLAARAIISRMPRPMTNRQAWERELREELPGQLARYQEELAATLSQLARFGSPLG
jgi:hypothetical protein